MNKQYVSFCPKCNSEWAHIIDDGDRKICVCTKCVHTQIFNTTLLATEKITSILDDLKDSNTPAIITSSYEKLITLIEEDEIYGALIKIKDTFELIIKLPLIIILSHISSKVYQKENSISDFAKDFSSLHSLLQKFIYDAVNYQLSLGNWETIAGIIKKHKIDELFPNIDTSNFLHVLWNINQKNHKAYTSLKDGTIASWRNKTIGHGALNCNKDDVKKDVLEKLVLLNNLLHSTMNDYAQIHILIKDNLITVKSTLNSSVLSVEPFMAIVNKDSTCSNSLNESKIANISVFESYNEKKQIGQIINYSDGQKHFSDKLTTMFTFIDVNLKKLPTLSLIYDQNIGYLGDDTIYSTEIEILNSFNETYFNNGTYFSDWFINCLDSYSGGVFLCCAERGMGKSAFTRAIDQTETIKIRNNNTLHSYLHNNSIELLIRTFHFNSYYNSDIFTFISKIKDIFTTNLVTEENNTTYLKPLVYISHNIEDKYNSLYNSINDVSITIEQKKNLFLTLLKSLLSIWRFKYQKQKLVLVLDGLDEIIDGESKINISDFLPDNKDLASNDLNGIYIILTSRCAHEIISNHKLYNLLTTYKFTNKLDLKREINQKTYNSPYSLAFISDIKKTFSISDNNQAISIGNSLEWRYNYLTAYKKLYVASHSKDLHHFIDDPFEFYLTQLSTLSRSYAEDIKSMLNLLSMSNEALTISEISYLITGDNKPTFKLYGMLMDIINFLNIERDYERGTLFNISHPDWIEKINKNQLLAENKKLLLNRLGTQLKKICSIQNNFDDFSTSTYDGESWLLSNMEKFTDEITNQISSLCNIDLGDSLYQLYRKLRLNFYIINCFESQNIINLNNKQVTDFISAHLRIAICYSKLNNITKSEEQCNKAIGICKQYYYVNKHQEDFILEQITKIYQIKGKILYENLYPINSVKFFKKSILMGEKLIKKYKIYTYSLAKSYNNLANIIRYENPYKAIYYYNNSIKIKEKLAEEAKNKQIFFDVDSINTTYNNLAITLKNIYPNDAKRYFQLVITSREKLAEQYEKGGNYFNLDSLANVYYSYAAFLAKYDSHKSLEFYDKALFIYKKLANDYQNGGKFFDLDHIASVYDQKAIIYRTISPKEALSYHKKAISIREKLANDYYNGGRFFNLHLLEYSYHIFAIYLKEHNHQEALILYNKSIEISEKLANDYLNGGAYYDLEELALNYNNKAVLLSKMNAKDEAMEYYSKALEIREGLADEFNTGGKFFDLKNLANSYHSLANFIKSNNPQKAMEYYSKALEIREKLADEFNNGGRFFDVFSLFRSYLDLANFQKNINPEKSIILYDKAINIGNVLANDYRNGGKFFDLNMLARAYTNKASLSKTIDHLSASNLYTSAINIREQLANDYRNGGKFFDLNDLAITYNNYANLLSKIDSISAKQLYIKSINIREQLANDYRNGGRFFDLNNLAISYTNYASFLKRTDPTHANQLYRKAIKINEQLANDYLNGGRFFDLDSLAQIYIITARFLAENNIDEAINFYNKAIKLREKLADDYKNGGRFFDLDLLTITYNQKKALLKTNHDNPL